MSSWDDPSWGHAGVQTPVAATSDVRTISREQHEAVVRGLQTTILELSGRLLGCTCRRVGEDAE